MWSSPVPVCPLLAAFLAAATDAMLVNRLRVVGRAGAGSNASAVAEFTLAQLLVL